MRVLDRIRSAFRPRNSASADELARALSLGSGTQSGQSVTPDTALTVSAVYACVRALSEDVAKLPLILHRRLPDGGKERATDHPLYELMHRRPNPYQTAFEFREMMQAHLALRGNAYAFINRAGGRVRELIPIRPDRVAPKLGDDGVTVTYRVQGVRDPLAASDVLHLRGLATDGLMGLSPVTLGREAIGMAKAAETHGAKHFRNGAKPGLVVTHPGELSETAFKNLKTSVEEQASGENVFRVLLLEEGVTPTALGFNQRDSQYIESRAFQVPEIARWYRMPLHKIQDMAASTNNNIEQQALEYLTDTLTPWLVRWEQRLSASLLSDKDRADGLFFEFLVDSILRGDTAARSAFFREMFGIGVYSPNDIRIIENLNPVEGGNLRFVPLNMIPLTAAAQLNKETGDGASN